MRWAVNEEGCEETGWWPGKVRVGQLKTERATKANQSVITKWIFFLNQRDSLWFSRRIIHPLFPFFLFLLENAIVGINDPSEKCGCGVFIIIQDR